MDGIEGFENEAYAVAAFVIGGTLAFAFFVTFDVLKWGTDIYIVLSTLIGGSIGVGMYFLLISSHAEPLRACPQCGGLDIGNGKCRACDYIGEPVELKGLQDYMAWKNKLQ